MNTHEPNRQEQNLNQQDLSQQAPTVTNPKKYRYRISEKAVADILSTIIEMTRRGEIDSAQFHDFVFAAYTYIEKDEIPPISANINPEKWNIIKTKIDKAARRSKAARERAAQRRSFISSAATQVGDLPPTATPRNSEEREAFLRMREQQLQAEERQRQWQRQSVIDYMRSRYGG